MNFWLAMYEVEPFGPRRDDHRASIQTAWTVNASRGQKDEKVKPADIRFVPEPSDVPAEQPRAVVQDPVAQERAEMAQFLE